METHGPFLGELPFGFTHTPLHQLQKAEGLWSSTDADTAWSVGQGKSWVSSKPNTDKAKITGDCALSPKGFCKAAVGKRVCSYNPESCLEKFSCITCDVLAQMLEVIPGILFW